MDQHHYIKVTNRRVFFRQSNYFMIMCEELSSIIIFLDICSLKTRMSYLLRTRLIWSKALLTRSQLDVVALERSHVLLVLQDDPVLPVEVHLVPVFVAQPFHSEIHHEGREGQTRHLKAKTQMVQSSKNS